jgi:N-acetylmuramoyl-L-alanine amidase CwlA
MVKVSVNRFVSNRIETIRKGVKADTQKLRTKTIKRLEEIFKEAAKVGRRQIRHQRINGKMVPITLNQQRRWVTVAKQTAITINSIASNFDEKDVDAQLEKLESLFKEVEGPWGDKNAEET